MAHRLMAAAVLRWVLVALAATACGVAVADPITLISMAVAFAPATLFSALTKFLIIAGLSVLGVAAQRRKQKKMAAAARAAYNASLQDRNVTVLGTEVPRPTVYGQPGPIGGAVVANFSSGERDEFRHLVVVFNSRPSEAIDEIYIDADPVGLGDNLDADGWVTDGPFLDAGNNGIYIHTVTFDSGGEAVLENIEVLSVISAVDDSGTWENPATLQTVTFSYSAPDTTLTGPPSTTLFVNVRQRSQDPRVNVQIHLSPSGVDTADAFLISQVPDKWTSDHKLSGWTYAVITLDLRMERFQSGPPNITAKGRWTCDIDDPRDDSTGYTRNPALILADYLKSDAGYRCSDAQIDEDALIAAANICDTVAYAEPSLTPLLDYLAWQNRYAASEALYVCDGAINTDVDRESARQSIEDSMAGFSHLSGGVWRIRAGAWETPVATIADADIIGPVQVVQASYSADKRYNGARGKYIDWQGTGVSEDFTPYVNSTFLAADGRERFMDLSMPMTSGYQRCIQLARVQTELSRGGLVLQVPVKMSLWHLQPGDRVELTHALLGMTGKTMRVQEWVWAPNAPLMLELIEDEESFYDQADEVSLDAAPNTNLPDPFVCEALDGLACESGTDQLLPVAGGLASRVLVSWTGATSQAVRTQGWVQMGWRYAHEGDADWRTVTLPGDAVADYITGAADGFSIVVRARFVNQLGVGGEYDSMAHTVAGKTEPPDPFDAFTVQVQPDGTREFAFAYTATPKPLDWQGAEIRYVAGLVDPGDLVWDDMSLLNADQTYYTASPVESNQLLAGEYTFACRSRDTTGNLSTLLSVQIDLPSRRLGDVAAEFNDAGELWPGTLTDCNVNEANVIEADDAGTWSDLTTWDAWTHWITDPADPIVYTSPVRDLTAVLTGLLDATLTATGTVTVELRSSATSDDPVADPGDWSAWGDPSAQFTARYFQLRLTVDATVPEPVPTISALSYRVSAPLKREYINDVDISTLTGSYRIGTGDIRVPLANTYSTLLRLGVVIQDSSAGAWTWQRIDNVLTYGPRLQFKLNGTLADPDFVDFFPEGI